MTTINALRLESDKRGARSAILVVHVHGWKKTPQHGVEPVPCTDYETDQDAWSIRPGIAIATIAELTTLLHDACRFLDETWGASSWRPRAVALSAWYATHREWHARVYARETPKKQREAERQALLAKLSPHEQALLGYPQ